LRSNSRILSTICYLQNILTHLILRSALLNLVPLPEQTDNQIRDSLAILTFEKWGATIRVDLFAPYVYALMVQGVCDFT
jgi:hypothetical protein